MQVDLRTSDLYQEAETLYRALRQPGTGQISDASDIHASPDGMQVVFAGTIVEKLSGTPPTRICTLDLASGSTRVLTSGPNVDRTPRYSPDGRSIAFLSDREESGNFQLYLLDRASGVSLAMPHVDGWIEYLHWSPDGARILLGVAGHGADVSGGQGAIASAPTEKATLSWMPSVKADDDIYQWRRAWIYEIAAGCVRQVSPSDCNVWETVWCGNRQLAAVASGGPGEGLWYSARLCIVPIDADASREIFRPTDQIGWPAATPSGNVLAFVEAICSDRWLVAGTLRVIEVSSGEVREVDTRGIDITYTHWRSEQHLLVAGHRGLESVVGLYDLASDSLREIRAGCDLSTGGRYISVAPLNDSGDCALVGESFFRSPEIAVIRGGEYHCVKAFTPGHSCKIQELGMAEPLKWTAPDGLEIEGWLIRPLGSPPHPTVMYIHGGPVWHWQPRWLGRLSLDALMLLRRGYAIFYPNPRGSAGYGQSFIRRVVGDMGGTDTDDYLSGLDHLIACGLTDASRLGVTGGSYGGFMTCWLITQDQRFAAAVAVAPIANYVSQHLISNVPEFVSLFLADRYTRSTGKYFERSPIMHAHKARTPTLNICGALDRCTPPQEALQFHNALRENNVESVLITYPEEGHGIRRLPALFDYCARLVYWFEHHMEPALPSSELVPTTIFGAQERR